MRAAIASPDLLRWLPNIDTYDPKICAKACDDNDDCKSFNLMILRDPSLAPDKDDCPNPPSQTRFACSLFTERPPFPLQKKDLIYSDMWYDFESVAAGSNGRSSPPLSSHCVDLLVLQYTTRLKNPNARRQTAKSVSRTPRSLTLPQPPRNSTRNPQSPLQTPRSTATAPPSSATAVSRWTTHPSNKPPPAGPSRTSNPRSASASPNQGAPTTAAPTPSSPTSSHPTIRSLSR